MNLADLERSWSHCLGDVGPPPRIQVKPENKPSSSSAITRTRNNVLFLMADLEPMDEKEEEEVIPPLKRARTKPSSSRVEEVIDVEEELERLAHEVFRTPKRKLTLPPINEKRDNGSTVSKGIECFQHLSAMLTEEREKSRLAEKVVQALEDRLKFAENATEEEKDRLERLLAEVRQDVYDKQSTILTMIDDMNHLQISAKESTLVAVLIAKVNLMKAPKEVRAKWDVQKEVDKWVKTYPDVDFGVDSLLPKPSLSDEESEEEADDEAEEEAAEEAGEEATADKLEEDASTETTSSAEAPPPPDENAWLNEDTTINGAKID